MHFAEQMFSHLEEVNDPVNPLKVKLLQEYYHSIDRNSRKDCPLSVSFVSDES